ncbi:MAG TPA: sulfatase [Gemmataceae bacterium]|jgi:arylsulfatase A-like enzyme
MKAVSLFGVFFIAKVLILAGRDVPCSAWTPLAFLWQDILIALLFGTVDYAIRRSVSLGWCLYGLISLYTAVNVPVACLLASPLTWPMLRAARGTLADSILLYITVANLLRMTVVIGVAIALPFMLRRLLHCIPWRWQLAGVAGASISLPLGPLATSQVLTQGLHRNVLTVLVTTALPRIAAFDHRENWRLSPFGSDRSEGLSRFRGCAAGRNVVLIHLESTAARYLAPYGALEDPMPNLSALSRKAIRFENAYAVYPETIKSFFSVHCSLYPALDTTAQMYEHAPAPALATLLAQRGYRTGLFHSGRFMYLGMDDILKNRGFDTLQDAGDIGGEHNSSFGIDEPSTVRRMLQWIDEQGTNPFFLTYLPIAGHHPYETPEPGPFPDGDLVNRYRNALHYSDAALGQFLEGLRQRRLDRKTLFLILGDHGEAFGEHPGNHGHTLCIWEENLRVPYLIVAPGSIEESVPVRRLASLIDTAPTVLDLLDLPIPSAYQGHSLLDAQTGMAFFCTDYSIGLLGLRDGDWKMIHELESGRSQLFDLRIDPKEQQDLSWLHSERTDVYRNHLLHWAAAQKYLITKSQQS